MKTRSDNPWRAVAARGPTVPVTIPFVAAAAVLAAFALGRANAEGVPDGQRPLPWDALEIRGTTPRSCGLRPPA